MNEPPERARILVAEDEAIISMMLLTQLGEAGHDVEGAADGDEALSLFQPGRFHLALSDLGMPGIPGDELSRRLRESDQKLVTILITGWKLEVDDPRRQSVDLYLQKPYVPSAVTEIVATALSLYAERASE